MHKKHELLALQLRGDERALKQVMRGITLTVGKRQQQALVFTATRLKSVIHRLDLAFADAFRRSELVAYKAWVAQLAGRTQGPLFVSLQRGEQAGAGTPTLRRLSDKSVNNPVRHYLGARYTAYSFRASFVTISKLNGVDDGHVMNQTKHKSSAMISRYPRLSDVVEHNATQSIDL